MQALTRDVEAVYPGVVIYGKGDPAHQLRLSDHNEDDTAGSRPAQSDADSNPEHRAIDVMAGPKMSLAQCQELVDNIVADPAARARLRYINFGNRQWHRRNNWEPVDNSDDPHPGHVHFSGDQADDENPAPWPAVYRGSAMSVLTDQILERWSRGISTHPQGGELSPVAWRVRDEKWQAGITAELSTLTGIIRELLDIIKAGGGNVDTQAILAGFDERLAAHRAAIDADTKDTVVDALTGGAEGVRADG